jgi:hypothetical protein
LSFSLRWFLLNSVYTKVWGLFFTKT